MELEKLKEIAQSYFREGKNIERIYATADGNFFYEKSKSACLSHSNTKKIEWFLIENESLKVSDTTEIKNEPEQKGKTQKIKGNE